ELAVGVVEDDQPDVLVVEVGLEVAGDRAAGQALVRTRPSSRRGNMTVLRMHPPLGLNSYPRKRNRTKWRYRPQVRRLRGHRLPRGCAGCVFVVAVGAPA